MNLKRVAVVIVIVRMIRRERNQRKGHELTQLAAELDLQKRLMAMLMKQRNL